MAHHLGASARLTLCASAGLTFVFVWSSLTDHAFDLHSALPASLAVNPRAFFLLGILALSVALACAVRAPRENAGAIAALLPFAGATGTACIAMAPSQSLFPAGALCAAGLIGLGLGYCWFVVQYGLTLACGRSIARLVYSMAAALIAEPVVRLCIEHIADEATKACIAVALPLASMLLLGLTRRLAREAQGADERSESEPTPFSLTPSTPPSDDLSVRAARACPESGDSPKGSPDIGAKQGRPATRIEAIGKWLRGDDARRFILLASCALLLATVRTLSPVGTWDAKFDPAPMTSQPTLLACYAACVILFARFALVGMERKPSFGRFQPAFLLVVLTLLASLIILYTQGPQSAVLYTLMCLDDSFAHMLFWTHVACLVRCSSLPARRIAGLAVGVYAAASIAWLFILGDVETPETLAVLAAVAALYVLTMVAANMSGAMQNGAAAKTAGADASHAPDDADALSARLSTGIEKRCDEIARQYRLSPRETEVLTLLAQGRTRLYIQEELVLAENTVKTHIAHIYKKLGINARNDLLDLIFDCGRKPDARGDDRPKR